MKSNKYKTLQGQHLGEKTVGNLKYLLNMLFKSCQECGGEAQMLPESRISGTLGCSKRGKQRQHLGEERAEAIWRCRKGTEDFGTAN